MYVMRGLIIDWLRKRKKSQKFFDQNAGFVLLGLWEDFLRSYWTLVRITMTICDLNVNILWTMEVFFVQTPDFFLCNKWGGKFCRPHPNTVKKRFLKQITRNFRSKRDFFPLYRRGHNFASDDLWKLNSRYRKGYQARGSMPRPETASVPRADILGRKTRKGTRPAIERITRNSLTASKKGDR